MTDDPNISQATDAPSDPWQEASRAALQALFDSALDAMVVVDDRARVIDANPAAAALRGEPRQALIGRWVGAFTAPDAIDEAMERWGAFLRDGTTRETSRVVRVDGEVREVEYAGTANFLPGRHLWVLRDVTDRNRAEREAQFRADLLDHVEAAVLAVDPHGLVTHWNAAAERLYGVPREEAVGGLVKDLVVAEGVEQTADEIIDRVREGSVWEGEFSVRRRNGDPVTA